MADLKRLEVKLLRDGIKSQYPPRAKECRICGSSRDLESHHTHSISALWNKYKKEFKIVIKDTEHIMVEREHFYAKYSNEVIHDLTTLCKICHQKLHSIYGKAPGLHTAKKQTRWIEIQRDKRIGES